MSVESMVRMQRPAGSIAFCAHDYQLHCGAFSHLSVLPKRQNSSGNGNWFRNGSNQPYSSSPKFRKGFYENSNGPPFRSLYTKKPLKNAHRPFINSSYISHFQKKKSLSAPEKYFVLRWKIDHRCTPAFSASSVLFPPPCTSTKEQKKTHYSWGPCWISPSKFGVTRTSTCLRSMDLEVRFA